MRRALMVVGKAPQPGRAKTRLAPPLSAEGAAELYRGFLLDAVALGLELGWERVTVVHPRGAGPALLEMLPREIHTMEQPGSGLADALSNAFSSHFDAGFERVVLIGSDNPTLPPDPIELACAALDNDDVAIGPTVDGGYYLLGLRRPQAALFDDIAWSTPRVFEQTLTRAQRVGLRIRIIQEWYDVDGPEDLERLRAELAAAPEHIAPHTRAALERVMARAGQAGAPNGARTPR